jgi:hypothetical protein
MIALLPKPVRKAEIVESLDYAEKLRNQISDATTGSYKVEGSVPKFISQMAGDVLARSRECFDHLGKDLIEAHLLPVADAKLAADYKSGKMTSSKSGDLITYFPYYTSMLEQPHRLFHRFKKANRAIYDKLGWFVGGIDRNGTLPGTSFRMRQFRTVADMVIEKKHGRVMYGRTMEYNVEPGEKLFMQDGDSSFVFDKGFRNDNPNFKIVLPPDAPSRLVPAYRFTGSGIDVYDLCLFAVHGTQLVMDTFYDAFFEPTAERAFKPDIPTITVSDKPPPRN